MLKNNQEIGQAGEHLAASFLKEKGHTIIQQNYRCKAGEIDIIAKHESYLVFVEVKTRSNSRYGMPEEAVDFRKQRQICKAIRYYLHQNNIDNQDIRFDIVAITLSAKGEKRPVIEHITNAFDYCL